MKNLPLLILCTLGPFLAFSQVSDSTKHINLYSRDSLYYDVVEPQNEGNLTLDTYKGNAGKAHQINQPEVIFILNETRILDANEFGKIKTESIVSIKSIEDHKAKGRIKKIIMVTTKE